jgi:pyrroloquinoline quinone (PQQ) biosynthesis protein C
MDARAAGLPSWLQDVVVGTQAERCRVARHEAWQRMRDGTISREAHRNILVGFWPLIERFPQFLALNLLKTRHGRDEAQNAARAWLARNLRVEQKHAGWFLDWGHAFGIDRDAMLDGPRPVEMTLITDWSWRVCESGELAEAMAATNYAIEGVTGEWTPGVAHSAVYRAAIVRGDERSAMRWLDAHADYDDRHPWQALELIAALSGDDPGPARVQAIRAAITRSYELYALALDAALGHAARERAAATEAVAAAPYRSSLSTQAAVSSGSSGR